MIGQYTSLAQTNIRVSAKPIMRKKSGILSELVKLFLLLFTVLYFSGTCTYLYMVSYNILTIPVRVKTETVEANFFYHFYHTEKKQGRKSSQVVFSTTHPLYSTTAPVGCIIDVMIGN
jgi:hypothetical protein